MSDANRGQEAKQAEIAEDRTLDDAIKQIAVYAAKIYNLMIPGMSIDIHLSDSAGLIVPGQQPKVHRLIITRPDLLVGIKTRQPLRCLKE